MYCLQWLLPLLLIPRPANLFLLHNHSMFMTLYLASFFLERRPCTICTIVFIAAVILICYSGIGNCLFLLECSTQRKERHRREFRAKRLVPRSQAKEIDDRLIITSRQRPRRFMDQRHVRQNEHSLCGELFCESSFYVIFVSLCLSRLQYETTDDGELPNGSFHLDISRVWFHFRDYCRFISILLVEQNCSFPVTLAHFPQKKPRSPFLLALLCNYYHYTFLSVMDFKSSLRVKLRWINGINME